MAKHVGRIYRSSMCRSEVVNLPYDVQHHHIIVLNIYVRIFLLLFQFFNFFDPSLLLSSSTPRRFYPQRPSGQAVVTGSVPSSPRYVPSIFIAHRVQHSHCSSIFIECCWLTLSRFPLINFLCKKKSLRVCALGENLIREIDFSRHQDNLPSHPGRLTYYASYSWIRE